MKEYQGFAISNFRTGFDEAVEPWLLPRDAYQILKNAHLYRGVLEKIPGYDIYARMSYTKTITLSPAPNGVTKTFTGTLSPLPSSQIITAQAATNAGATTVETFAYGSDTPPNTINLIGSGGVGSNGTIDITTGAVTLNFAVIRLQGSIVIIFSNKSKDSSSICKTIFSATNCFSPHPDQLGNSGL